MMRLQALKHSIFRTMVFIALLLFPMFSEAAMAYEKAIDKTTNVEELEKVIPDFPAKVLNDDAVEEEQKYALVLKYSKISDGEYGLSFACDCFDFLAKIYALDGSSIDNKEFIDFLLKKAQRCEFGMFPRYKDARQSEVKSQWSIILEKTGLNDRRLTADIESNIETIEK